MDTNDSRKRPRKNTEEEAEGQKAAMTLQPGIRIHGIVRQNCGELIFEVNQDLARVEEAQGDLGEQLLLLTSIVNKQQQSIELLRKKCLDNERASMRYNILIHNMPENKNEDIARETFRLLRTRGVPGNLIDFERVHRIGARREQGPDSQPRLVVARLARQDLADRILEITKPPKGTPFDKKAIRIVPHYPTELRHARAKMDKLATMQERKIKGQKLKLKTAI